MTQHHTVVAGGAGCDISVAPEHLVWDPTISLRDGLAHTIDWFRQGSHLDIAGRVA